MSDKEYMECSVVAYPREIRFLHINGSAISYYVDRHISDYVDRLQKENQELKKQLEEAQENIILLKASKPMLNYKKALEENQQKEFIEYMNKTIEELECDDVDDEEMKGYLIQRIDIYKEILSKFKKIIGSDINVGSKGGKE